MGISLHEYCLQNGREELMAQWHPALNGTLTPHDVTQGSHKKVWWICEKGHEWQAMIKSRVAGCGCPFCTCRTVVPHENDLATTHPYLVPQWHPSLNGRLTPHDVSARSKKKVWWFCEKGHVWQSVVHSRTSKKKCGCPICARNVRNYNKIL